MTSEKNLATLFVICIAFILCTSVAHTNRPRYLERSAGGPDVEQATRSSTVIDDAVGQPSVLFSVGVVGGQVGDWRADRQTLGHVDDERRRREHRSVVIHILTIQ